MLHVVRQNYPSPFLVIFPQEDN